MLHPDFGWLFSKYKLEKTENRLVKKCVGILILFVLVFPSIDAHANCWKRDRHREFYGADTFEPWISKISWDEPDVLKVTGTAIGYLCQRVDTRKSVWRPESLYGKEDIYIRLETYWKNLVPTKAFAIRVDQNSDFSFKIKSSDFFSPSELQRLKNGEEVSGKYFDLVISLPSENYPVRIRPYRADFRQQYVIKVENRK